MTGEYGMEPSSYMLVRSSSTLMSRPSLFSPMKKSLSVKLGSKVRIAVGYMKVHVRRPGSNCVLLMKEEVRIIMYIT